VALGRLYRTEFCDSCDTHDGPIDSPQLRALSEALQARIVVYQSNTRPQELAGRLAPDDRPTAGTGVQAGVWSDPVACRACAGITGTRTG
jgi:hypothetical protein